MNMIVDLLIWLGARPEGRSLLAGIMIFIIAIIDYRRNKNMSAVVTMLFILGSAFIAVPVVSELSWGDVKIRCKNNAVTAEAITGQLIEMDRQLNMLAKNVSKRDGKQAEVDTEQFRCYRRVQMSRLEALRNFAILNNAPVVSGGVALALPGETCPGLAETREFTTPEPEKK